MRTSVIYLSLSSLPDRPFNFGDDWKVCWRKLSTILKAPMECRFRKRINCSSNYRRRRILHPRSTYRLHVTRAVNWVVNNGCFCSSFHHVNLRFYSVQHVHDVCVPFRRFDSFTQLTTTFSLPNGTEILLGQRNLNKLNRHAIGNSFFFSFSFTRRWTKRTNENTG